MTLLDTKRLKLDVPGKVQKEERKWRMAHFDSREGSGTQLLYLALHAGPCTIGTSMMAIIGSYVWLASAAVPALGLSKPENSRFEAQLPFSQSKSSVVSMLACLLSQQT
jgi:hypothetical protein